MPRLQKRIVHLTNHEDNLNIMVEDNGNGFDLRQIIKQKQVWVLTVLINVLNI